MTRFILFFTQQELSEDPQDLIANYLINSANNFSLGVQHFFSLYLLSHGIIKLFLVAGLLRKKLWAYLVSLFIFSFFIVYQSYRYFFTHSFWLLVLTVFDLIIVSLVWQEYNYLKKSKKVDWNKQKHPE